MILSVGVWSELVGPKGRQEGVQNGVEGRHKRPRVHDGTLYERISPYSCASEIYKGQSLDIALQKAQQGGNAQEYNRAGFPATV